MSEVRDATLEDASEVLRIYAPIVAKTAISFEEEPPDVAEIRKRIGKSQVWLGAEENSAVVGSAYAWRFHPRAAYRWSIEVSVYLAQSARGRGIGKVLLRAVLDRLIQSGFVNAFAGIALPNPSSVALFESFGFVKIAHWKQIGFKLGAWHDVAWWQLQLQEPSVPPPQLRTV
jgi:L-amino acid N-acyltransferase YncA